MLSMKSVCFKWSLTKIFIFLENLFFVEKRRRHVHPLIVFLVIGHHNKLSFSSFSSFSPFSFSDHQKTNFFQPSGCDNVDCCGAAQVGGEPLEQVNEWCESETPHYSLKLGERSPIINHEAQETAFFRFFVPEEAHCKPFQILIRPFYGVPVIFLSNLYAFPNAETSQWRKGTIPPTWGSAQNSFVVCPNAHADYQLGTYSLAVFSWYSSSFYVEIVVSPQEHPLVPPPGRILCEDVPESQLSDALGGFDESPVYCMQDTESISMNFGEDFAGKSAFLVLPVPAGILFFKG